MERNVTISLEKAREWYNSDNISLKEVALQAFSQYELESGYTQIRTLRAACDTLGFNYYVISAKINDIVKYSRATAAMFKLNIIRRALNLGHNLYLTENPKNSYIYYPYNPAAIEFSSYTLEEQGGEVVGRIKNKENIYNVYGNLAYSSTLNGLGCFDIEYKACYAKADCSFLGCATKDIAKHFGKYFGMLITEAKYGDIVDFEIIEDKYQ